MSITQIQRKNRGTGYRVRVKRHGREVSKTFARKFDAMQFEKEILFGSVDFDSVGYTFKQAADDWIAKHAEIKKAPKSLDTDKQMLKNKLIPHMGRYPLRDIRADTIDELISLLKKKGLSNSTINRNLELARAIFNYAIKCGKASFNPVKAVGLLRRQRQPYAFWERHEAEVFLAYVEAKYEGTGSYLGFIYKLALNTGMRMGELLGLHWSDVVCVKRFITVQRSYDSFQGIVKHTTKGMKVRLVPINDAIYDDLVRLKTASKGNLVFATANGRPVDGPNMSRYFDRDVKESRVRRIRFHDMRHTYASHFMMNGGDVFHLKEILGHSDIKTTMHYSHLSPDSILGKANFVSLTAESNVVPFPEDRRLRAVGGAKAAQN